jgi:hypothetical protein
MMRIDQSKLAQHTSSIANWYLQDIKHQTQSHNVVLRNPMRLDRLGQSNTYSTIGVWLSANPIGQGCCS